MDYDIEMEDAVVDSYPIEESTTQDILQVEDPQVSREAHTPPMFFSPYLPNSCDQEDGEIEDTTDGPEVPLDEQTQIPTKVHIRGLDNFNPDDIKAYVKEHYGDGCFERVEWIDDTSANLLFRSESSAAEALIALSAVEIEDTTQLPAFEMVPAKGYSKNADAHLRVRFAVVGDKKTAGAAQRSRFYLLNPEYDPEERRRRGEFDRKRYRDRDGYGDRRNGRRRRDDRYSEERNEFDVNLYDDDADALAKRSVRYRRRDSRSRSRSRSSDSSRGRGDRGDRYAHNNRDKELFPDGPGKYREERSTVRNRSASPARSTNGDGEDRWERGAASRNRHSAQSLKDRITRDNSSKELFPSKAGLGVGVAQMDQVDETEIMTKRLSGMFVSNQVSAVVSRFKVKDHGEVVNNIQVTKDGWEKCCRSVPRPLVRYSKASYDISEGVSDVEADKSGRRTPRHIARRVVDYSEVSPLIPDC